jgi:hypothetical protein
VQVEDFMVFAEFFQFFIQDAETDDTLPIHWEPEDEDLMVMVTNNVISVRTARELEVPINLIVDDARPEDPDFDDWDQVVECSLQLDSGKLLITGPSEDVYESQRVQLEPGIYGVRIYYGNLSEIDSDGFEGDDNYRVCVWKVPSDQQPPAFQILKHWMPVRHG